MNLPDKLTILIVDDHDMVREGIKLLLESIIKSKLRVDTVNSAKEALRKCNSSHYDIIFMDIKMPETDGITATKMILEKWDTNIIALSMHSELLFAEKMLEAGAKGYLLKNSSPDELICAIERVLLGKFYYISEISNSLLEKDSRKPTSKKNKKVVDSKIKLTKREKQILDLIMLENTNDVIAKKLFLSKRTVDIHRQNILRKCDVKNTAGLIKLSLKLDLI